MKYFLIVMIAVPSLLYSQGWKKDFGPGFGYSVQQTNDNGYILTGSLYNGNYNSNLALIKTNINGDSLWIELYGDTNESSGLYVTQTNDGGYFVGGNIASIPQSIGAFLVKTDPAGDTLWTKKYNGFYGRSFQQTNDGGYVITGYKFSDYSQGNDFFIIKTDSNGDTIWTKTYDENNGDYGYCINQTIDGGYIITGATKPTNSNYDIYVLKTDSLGNFEWSKTFGGYSKEEGYSIIQNADGSYMLLGYTNDYQGVPCGYEQIFLIKMDSVGDTLWTKRFNMHTHNYGYAILRNLNGEYIITGTYHTASHVNKIYLVKTDSFGDTMWTKTYGDGTNCEGHSVHQTNDGGYIITGWDNSSSGAFILVLIKTDVDGNMLYINKLTLNNKNKILIKMTDLTGREIVKPQINVPFIEIYDDGTAKKKMITH